MSKKHHECCCEPEYRGCGGYGSGFCGGSYSNIYGLLILILIVCQFCRNKDDDECESHGLIDNSILFIIVIFILVYCSCRK